MSCLTLTVRTLTPIALGVLPKAHPVLTLTTEPHVALNVTTGPCVQLSVVPHVTAALNVVPGTAVALTLGEVCVISGGDLVVLAGTDGPLRTKTGGYILLNPATNPASSS